jgi:hypothetical protein
MQIEAFFKKNVIFSNETVCKAAAEDAFKTGEIICRNTNKRIDYYISQHSERLPDDLHAWLESMYQDINVCLGDRNEFLNELPRLLKFTAGATAESARKKSRTHRKFRKSWKIPPAGAAYVETMARYFGLGDAGFRVVPSSVNRVEFVAKNWKTHRTIACEPTGAIPFQLAFDSYVKRRLRKHYGIDLSDQSRNREMAKVGSIDGSLATVDLRMASDTNSYNTTRLLLPDAWWLYVASFRSTHGKLPSGERIRYAKFSSMGNGTTFPLETLFFCAACKAVGSERFSVYGDDILIESHLAPQLLRLLKFLGFLPNVEKTYVSGPFRESCGGNYYEGEDITPFYIRNWGPSKGNHSVNLNGLLAIAIPQGRLWARLVDVMSKLGLKLVPWNESSYSGVMIAPSDAYSLKIIRNNKGSLTFKGYNNVARDEYGGGIQNLLRWHHSKVVSPKLTDNEFTRVGDLVTKCLLERMAWFVPRSVMPPHLYWLGADLAARRKAGRGKESTDPQPRLGKREMRPILTQV